MGISGRRSPGPRCIALAGPFQSGKTSLFEAILKRTGTLEKAGDVDAGTSFGDASPEARSHGHGVEPSVVTVDWLGEPMTFIDCPGSTEFMHAMRSVVPVCDAAVVVCEPDERKLASLQLVLRELEDAGIPRILFLNKIDAATDRVQQIIPLLQPASRVPLVLRQLPLWSNGIAVGFVDLALERAFIYREHAPSEVVDVPVDSLALEKEARFAMLERLADHDDSLLEELLGDIEPPQDQIFDDLRREVQEGLVVPVMIGSAKSGHGVGRLLKSLRHDAPGPTETRRRLGLPDDGPALAHVVRTVHATHGGRSTVARVLRGKFKEGDVVTDSDGHETKLGPLSIAGATNGRARPAEVGEGMTISIARAEALTTGVTFAAGRFAPECIAPLELPEPLHAFALETRDPKDDAKLSAALNKLAEEDPGLTVTHDATAHEIRLGGQGEVHLRVAVEKLASRYGVVVEAKPPQVDYHESIRKAVQVRGRHKKQTGGHGQFGDVVLRVAPLPRGAGISFIDEITGGVVPRQYISSVEHGVREALQKGPLGCPVVDVEVRLVDGSYHSVDSSDMAFRAAGRIAMQEALAQAGAVLLEPVHAVDVAVPSDAMARAVALVSGRRGQILGYDSRPGWQGWDVLQALMPEAELRDFIVELRSATSGLGTFRTQFDHLAETTGRTAEAAIRRLQAH